jgi:hypothetical protein
MSKTSEYMEAIPDVHYVEPTDAMNEDEFEKVIRSRRSVRVYTVPLR